MGSITLLENLSLLFRGLGLVPYLLYVALRTRSRCSVQIALKRYITESLSTRQIQYIMPPSQVTYRSWAHANGIVANVEEIKATGEGQADARLMWIGEWTPGRKVLLYLHGGAYVMPMVRQYLELCVYVRSVAMREKPEDMTVAILEYENTPGRRYPYQLIQASTAFASLLERGISPADIVIMGDSAGGHLALCLISHMLHPHPLARAIPTPLPSPLAGLILISPATTFKLSADSFRRNNGKDVIALSICQYWSDQLYGGDSPYWSEFASGGYWGEAVKAPASWWTGVGGLAKRCLITGGTDEVILDDIVEMSTRLQGLDENWVVERIIGKGEIHDACLMDFVMVGKAESETVLRAATFARECFA